MTAIRRRVLTFRRDSAELPQRFAERGLTIHPDKTRLVRFRPRPKRREWQADDVPGPSEPGGPLDVDAALPTAGALPAPAAGGRPLCTALRSDS